MFIWSERVSSNEHVVILPTTHLPFISEFLYKKKMFKNKSSGREIYFGCSRTFQMAVAIHLSFYIIISFNGVSGQILFSFFIIQIFLVCVFLLTFRLLFGIFPTNFIFWTRHFNVIKRKAERLYLLSVRLFGLLHLSDFDLIRKKKNV